MGDCYFFPFLPPNISRSSNTSSFFDLSPFDSRRHAYSQSARSGTHA